MLVLKLVSTWAQVSGLFISFFIPCWLPDPFSVMIKAQGLLLLHQRGEKKNYPGSSSSTRNGPFNPGAVERYGWTSEEGNRKKETSGSCTCTVPTGRRVPGCVGGWRCGYGAAWLWLCCVCIWVVPVKENDWEQPESLDHIFKQLHRVHDVLVLQVKKKRIRHQKF